MVPSLCGTTITIYTTIYSSTNHSHCYQCLLFPWQYLYLYKINKSVHIVNVNKDPIITIFEKVNEHNIIAQQYTRISSKYNVFTTNVYQQIDVRTYFWTNASIIFNIIFESLTNKYTTRNLHFLSRLLF